MIITSAAAGENTGDAEALRFRPRLLLRRENLERGSGSAMERGWKIGRFDPDIDTERSW